MKTFACLLIIATLLAAKAEENQKAKRYIHIGKFAKMIKCKTGRSALSYYNYGNYCGLGNSGKDPVDDTDRCCRDHDYCYDNLKAGVCKSHRIYSTLYQTDGCASCSSSNSGCGAGLCECDRIAANCFSHASYSSANLG